VVDAGAAARSVEIGTLLGRRECRVGSVEGRSLVSGKRVLVTGAGGAIGRALCKRISSFDTAALCLMDHDESNLQGLLLETVREASLDADELVIADVRDRARVDQVFGRFKPDVVFHAAGYKHLPLLEMHPCEAVKTNVIGTQNVVEAALRHGVRRLVNVSTFKAADPASVHGATARLAELVVHANAVGITSMGSVRLGHVLGSRRSFLTMLADQIARGQPVTLSHSDVTRSVMTLAEAVGLLLCAASMAEFGEIFVLEVGEPVRVLDVVHAYAQQANASVTIKHTGLRPGEKLSENAFGSCDGAAHRTANPLISAAGVPSVPEDFGTALSALSLAAEGNDARLVRRELRRLLPEYRPTGARVPTAARMTKSLLTSPYADGF
jgi:FlaA1/EpsC-like NDP-sugar epimerase